MPDERLTLEKRVEQLDAEVRALSLRVEQLAIRLNLPESERTAAKQQPPDRELLSEEPVEVAEEILSWAGKASLLPRLSTLCFLLVVALALRTITDNGLVDKLIGSTLGMGYAVIIMAAGWYKYSRRSPLAPVFAACGAVLMATIVVETHAHFQSLPLVPAYLTLMGTGVAMALLSRQFNAFIPISIGTLSMCFAGVAIDYPHPFFPYMAMVLLTANLLGYFAARLKRCSWLRWTILVVTMVMLQLWSIRLGQTFLRHQQPEPSLALDWFLPALAIFSVTYLVIALAGIISSGSERISKFDFTLPTVNAVWIFAAALYMVNAWGKGTVTLGIIGVTAATGHLVATFWLASRRIKGAPGTNSFAFAGFALMALALPVATGHFLLSLPVLSWMAFFMAIISRQWQNGGVRATTYLVQIYACSALAVQLSGSGPGAVDVINLIPAGLLAITNLFHYQWCRQWKPPLESIFYSRFDREDRTGVLLLLAALASGFYMLRTSIHQTLVLFMSGDITTAFSSAQSVIINSSAAVLMLLAYARNNREVRNVAILVTIIGAIKVFLYDLFGIHGVPLVISVFSFGLAAALESIALGRWQRSSSEKTPE